MSAMLLSRFTICETEARPGRQIVSAWRGREALDALRDSGQVSGETYRGYSLVAMTLGPPHQMPRIHMPESGISRR